MEDHPDEFQKKNEYFKELGDQARAHVGESLDYYTKRVRLFQFLFRITGTVMILCSVALPSLVHLPDPYRAPTVSIVSFLVAALAALNSFYSWHKTWEKYTSAILALQHLLATWEMDMRTAFDENYPKAKVDANRATSYLYTKMFETVTIETKDYFARAIPPQSEPSQTAR